MVILFGVGVNLFMRGRAIICFFSDGEDGAEEERLIFFTVVSCDLFALMDSFN